jgi:chitinase
VATVSSTGLVTALSPGNTTVSVLSQDGGLKASLVVTVSSNVVAVTGVSVTPTTLALVAGQGGALTASVNPSNATNPALNWSSSNTTVATISAAGYVTAVTAGSARITATSQDGNFTTGTSVTVTTASNGGGGATTSGNVISAYLLIESVADLQRYSTDLAATAKPNFNRLILSFVRPQFPTYTHGDLSNSGIMGHYQGQDASGVSDFNLLKAAVQQSQAKNISVFLSVGGWNYSCDYAGPSGGSACGPAPTSTSGYDTFIDPTTDPSLATTAYGNIDALANDLGADGVDIDYEEFWHADAHATDWSCNPWTTSNGNAIKAAGLSFANVVSNCSGSGSSGGSGPFYNGQTVIKFLAILNAFENSAQAKALKFSIAAGPVAATPITSFVYGDNTLSDVLTYGGVWWKGNLKGLLYSAASLNKAPIQKLDAIGVMTYDICGDATSMCQPYAGAAVDLASQVSTYMQMYTNWIGNKTASAAQLDVTVNGKVTLMQEKFALGNKLQFGVEINQPAYPAVGKGTQLPLTNALAQTLINQQASKSNGLIMWQLYSKENIAIADYAVVKNVLNMACTTFLAGDSRYNCSANFPSEVR